jgi:hypothetical protein
MKVFSLIINSSFVLLLSKKTSPKIDLIKLLIKANVRLDFFKSFFKFINRISKTQNYVT